MRRPNRLINEKSPYLLQHALNPVDWHPWGEEAFELARREDKPVFLSIGYSTCHWCHVMERESFEDEDIALLLNDAFVCVKVDREERPDVDGVYMDVCMMMTGGGGWPLTIVMTPDKIPFYAATYIPKESIMGRIGLMDLVPRIKKLWSENRRDVLESAGQVASVLKRKVARGPGETPGKDLLEAAYDSMAKSFDPANGGFGKAPKFPVPHGLMFLLRYWLRTGEGRALEMAEATLRAMRRGGIYDHVGSGFHRYSTDERWLLPHFEKMLYDQALLVMAYSEAFLATGRPEYAETAGAVISYVLRDMTSEDGAFFTAEDADSEGEEGRFYLWREEEIRAALPEHEAGAAISDFNVQKEGNYRDELTGRLTGKNILHATKDPAPAAPGGLLSARDKRIRPMRDEKVLADMNGLMIAALSKAACALGRPEYADAARRAADFLLDKTAAPDGGLLHRYKDGEALVGGFLDDHAFLIWGLIELYEAVLVPKYLRAALYFARTVLELFEDKDYGGFYFTGSGAEELPRRKKEVYDGALPSGNSVMALNLLRLARMTGDHEFEAAAARTMAAFSKTVSEAPSAHALYLCALDFMIGPSSEVVVSGALDADDTREMLRALRSVFAPNKVILHWSVPDIAPFTSEMEPIGGRTTAYLCRNFSCGLPTTDPKEAASLLSGAGRPPGRD